DHIPLRCKCRLIGAQVNDIADVVEEMPLVLGVLDRLRDVGGLQQNADTVSAETLLFSELLGVIGIEVVNTGASLLTIQKAVHCVDDQGVVLISGIVIALFQPGIDSLSQDFRIVFGDCFGIGKAAV